MKTLPWDGSKRLHRLITAFRKLALFSAQLNIARRAANRSARDKGITRDFSLSLSLSRFLRAMPFVRQSKWCVLYATLAFTRTTPPSLRRSIDLPLWPVFMRLNSRELKTQKGAKRRRFIGRSLHFFAKSTARKWVAKTRRSFRSAHVYSSARVSSCKFAIAVQSLSPRDIQETRILRIADSHLRNLRH